MRPPKQRALSKAGSCRDRTGSAVSGHPPRRTRLARETGASERWQPQPATPRPRAEVLRAYTEQLSSLWFCLRRRMPFRFLQHFIVRSGFVLVVVRFDVIFPHRMTFE